jgi:hypothetical protein
MLCTNDLYSLDDLRNIGTDDDASSNLSSTEYPNINPM